MLPSAWTRFLVVLAVFAFLAPASANADESFDRAADFVRELGNEAVEILGKDDLDLSTAENEFDRLLSEGFDLNTIGRFVLGRYWNSASEEQQREYLDLFRRYVIDTYASRFDEYSGETFEVSRTTRHSERDIVVTTRIFRTDGGPPVEVGWRVRERGNDFQIIDVIVEEVSMSVTQRSEFASVIQRSGGDVGALIEALRRHVEG